jgi:hypothetical protein
LLYPVLPLDSARFRADGTEKRAASRHHLPQAERYLVAFSCATWYRGIWREMRRDGLEVETRLPTHVSTDPTQNFNPILETPERSDRLWHRQISSGCGF